MPINLHAEENRQTYALRDADKTWYDAMRHLVHPQGLIILDVGCGGGIYSKAWARIGAKSVMGVDSSAVMLDAARNSCIDEPAVTFHRGDALATGLDSNVADVVFERALIHHVVPRLEACFVEAYRLLRSGGLYIIQDRSPEDVQLPGSVEHICGYFFERYPKLLNIELGRRPHIARVVRELEQVGFQNVRTVTVWETRKVHWNFAELAEDLARRTGRSILHDLTDEEVVDLIAYIESRVGNSGHIVEKDRWTVYVARV